ncbi:Non-specific serine threonine protein kinase [Sarracenia purpurea var. burkii]
MDTEFPSVAMKVINKENVMKVGLIDQIKWRSRVLRLDRSPVFARTVISLVMYRSISCPLEIEEGNKSISIVKNPSSSHKPQRRTSLIWSDSKPKLKSAIDGPSECPDESVEAIEKT